MNSFSVLIPVYNEEKMIRETVAEVDSVMRRSRKKYEIIAIDDGSKDSSLRIMKSIKGLKVLVNPYNMGYGASLKKGLLAACGEKIIILDADGTYPVADLPGFIKECDKYDMVVGSRVKDKCGVPFFRRPAKWFLNLFAGFVVKTKIPDLNSGFRIFNKNMAMRFFNLYPSGFSFTSTITMAALSHDYTVKFVPIDYFERTGKSSINPFHFVDFMFLIFRLSTLFNPLRVFFPISLLFLIAGVVYGTYQFAVISNIGDLPVIFVLVGMQILLFGFIADAVSRNRK